MDKDSRIKVIKRFIIFIFFALLLILLFNFKNLSNTLKIFRKPVIQEVSLPEGFPDIPVYKNSELLSSVVTPSAEGNTYSATWETQDAVSSVFEWYSTTLEDNGWILDGSTKGNDGDMYYLTFTKLDKYMECWIKNNPEKGKSEITINIMKISEYGEED